MRRTMKYIFVTMTTLVCIAVALLEYSSYHDRKQFSAARNNCETGCIQDSGGLDKCREICAQHPDRYP